MEFATSEPYAHSSFRAFHEFEVERLNAQISALQSLLAAAERERDAAKEDATRFQEALLGVSRLLLAAAGPRVQ